MLNIYYEVCYFFIDYFISNFSVLKYLFWKVLSKVIFKDINSLRKVILVVVFMIFNYLKYDN